MSETSERRDTEIRGNGRADDPFEGYYGFVKFDEVDSNKAKHDKRDMVTIVGFVEEVTPIGVAVVEAFAMSIHGWSHADLGQEHIVPWTQVKMYHLMTHEEWRQELENSGS